MTSNFPRASALCAFACLWLVACGGPPATDAPLPASNAAATPFAEDTQPPPNPMRDKAQHDLSDIYQVPPGAGSNDTPSTLLWASDLEVREAALEVIISEPSTHEQDLLLVLTDANVELRETAVDLLADRGGELAIRLLRAAAFDPHPAVRQAAIEGLQELGAEQ